MSNQQMPTAERFRAVRRLGVSNALNHLPQAKRDKLLASYAKQDERRERNVSAFAASVRASKK